MYGNLVVAGYMSAKPFVSLRVATTGGIPSTGTTTNPMTIGTVGTTTLAQYGFITNATVARGTVGATNAFLYTFSWATPHPVGTSYAVMCNFNTGSTASPSPNAFITANNTSSTSITIWIRGSTNIMQDGNFFVYTVP
jgi:hypothetical protein